MIVELAQVPGERPGADPGDIERVAGEVQDFLRGFFNGSCVGVRAPVCNPAWSTLTDTVLHTNAALTQEPLPQSDERKEELWLQSHLTEEMRFWKRANVMAGETRKKMGSLLSAVTEFC